MTQIQYIRLSGHPEAFALTQAGHERLLGYLSKFRATLSTDPDGDEALRKEFRVDWVRTVFLLLTRLTAGVLGVVYLVALLFVPRVESVEEYRRMRDALLPLQP